MQAKIACSALIAIGLSGLAAAAEKPRVFITESASPQLSGDAAVAAQSPM
jgi:hypothetical protein